MLLIAEEDVAKEHGWTPRARIVASAAAGVEPQVMGLGPVDAVRKLCSAMSTSVSQFEAIELNEAFAVQSFAVIRALGLDEEKVNMTPQDRRRFAAKLDFMTSPGYLTGKGAREAAGLPGGAGPHRFITNMAVMGYDEETCRMKVLSINEGHTREEVIENTGFELLFAEHLEVTKRPTKHDLKILREEVDPTRVIIGR